VSSDDFGHDEFSTRSLAKKHRAVTEEIAQHQAAVTGLREQVSTLGLEYQELEEVQRRVGEVEGLNAEVREVASLRRQWLQDALAVYRMFSEVNACEVWIDEKEQWLIAMVIPDNLEELEVVQHRFESLDQEMTSLLSRVVEVNEVVQQLVESGHPSTTEVRGCQDHL
uniref:Spectrin beta chain, non-erythrocytic 1-like n=1 Tax=Callorhinchus milii TaxID=7868 RepID=A0A4W3H4K2_CALMI